MQEVDKVCVIKMGASGWMFLLVLAHQGNPRQRAIIWLRVCSLTVILLIWPATSLKIVHLALWTKPWHTSFDYSGTTASQQWEYEKCQMSTINISTDNVINGFKFTSISSTTVMAKWLRYCWHHQRISLCFITDTTATNKKLQHC